MNARKDADPQWLGASLRPHEQVARQRQTLPSQFEPAGLAGDETRGKAGDFLEGRREGLKRAPRGACHGMAKWRGLVCSGHKGFPGQLMSLVIW